MCFSEPEKKLFFVLGMHRSGTSALAGSLQEAGVFFVSDPGIVQDNRKGNYENPEVWGKHEKALEESNCSWYAPAFEIQTPLWFLDWQINYADNLMRHHDLCGIKDPRSILFVTSWLEAFSGLSHKVIPIGVFRHPFRVAASLEKRDTVLDKETFIPMWEYYNRHLLYWKHRLGFPLFDFDDYRFGDNVKALCESFELPKAPQFYEEKYINQTRHDYQELPNDTFQIYERLVQAAWEQS